MSHERQGSQQLTAAEYDPELSASISGVQLTDAQAQLLEGMPTELREAVTGLAVAIETSERKQGATALAAAETAREAVQMMLPLFEAAYALPNAWLRSALFPALDTKQTRRFVKGEKLYSVGEWSVVFTGEQFDQGDLDVLAGILEIGAPVGLGGDFTFSSYELLKLLGKETGGAQYVALHQAIIRLTGGTVEIRRRRGRLFFGTFIREGEAGSPSPDGARQYIVSIHPRLGALFGFDMWSQVHREQRRALGKNSTAKALHGYYSSHAAPGAHRYETLAGIAGLQNKQKAGVKRRIIKAHDAMAAPACGFLTGFEAGPETITVQKAHTPSQVRHLGRVRRGPGRPRKQT